MQTLNFVRKATEEKDNTLGYLYIHHWPTGWQELIFNSKEKAKTWLKNENEEN